MLDSIRRNADLLQGLAAIVSLVGLPLAIAGLAGTLYVVSSLAPLSGEFLVGTIEGVDENGMHDGASKLKVQVKFNQDLNVSFKTLKKTVSVSGGECTSFRRVDQRDDLWEVAVKPSGEDKVVVSMPRTTNCAGDDAICTADGKPLGRMGTLCIPHAKEDCM